jgi:hypothetical protein
MPAFNEQTALRRDILTPPVRQRDEAFHFSDRLRTTRSFWLTRPRMNERASGGS